MSPAFKVRPYGWRSSIAQEEEGSLPPMPLGGKECLVDAFTKPNLTSIASITFTSKKALL
eukprot:CAMPEP_0113887922 /NCGR_PEP_ID=MMETSP0780_2-20120614/12529_1 /TAXON_ID=652834 /ORGANISM="Palpitomonas bilix" /LENGTH=59 /DNA_ID=CAMNT_0000876601 /DNA_START=129 /DNA_END=305 /DNA_ORIENTATION=- /assembly_acc=CAM_ASM_000599